MIQIQAIADFLAADFQIDTVLRLPSGKGSQIRLGGGEIVNVFDTGTMHVQGKGDLDKVETVLAEIPYLTEGLLRLSANKPADPGKRTERASAISKLRPAQAY